MTAGMIEMLKLCVGCLDLMWQLLCLALPMVLFLPILSWMMSIVLGQRKLLQTALTTLRIIVEAMRELGSFAEDLISL